MRVDVTLDEKDYLEHIKFYFRQTPGGVQVMRRTDRMLWMVVVLTPVLVAAVLLLAEQREAVILAGLLLVLLVALYPLMKRRTRNQILQNSLTVLRADRNALYFLPGTVEITPEHFLRETELSYTRLSWKVVENVYETPTHLFIFLGSAMGTITIPLRCFNSPQEASAFAVAARQYLDAAKAVQRTVTP